MDKLEQMKDIVDTFSYKEVDGCLIDVQTANLILKVYDALGEENRKKFISHDVGTMAKIAWKLV